MSNSKPKPIQSPFPLFTRFPSRIERFTYRLHNSLDNRLWPVRPLYFTASAAAIGAYHWKVPHNLVLDILPTFENKYAELAKICAVSVTTAYIPVFFIRQFLKFFYFSYKRWLFENPKKPSFSTKIWGIWRKLLSFSPPILKSCDNLLPSLPVPSLEDTVSRYLESIKQLHTKEEFDLVKEQSVVFLREEGRRLQTYAKIYSLFSSNYVTPFWEKYAYLYNRENLLINSSVAHVDLLEDRPATWAHRAAHVTYIECLSHLAIDRQTYKPLGDGLLCARHYDKMYAVTRVPEKDIDHLENYGISKHIVLLYKGNMYKVRICDNWNRIYTLEQLTKIFAEIISREDTPLDGPEGKIPALTADRRDTWAQNRKRFFLDHKKNKEALKTIESAVFFLIYDPSEEFGYDSENPDKLSNFLRSMLTGDGANRWTDKSLNYIVSKTTKCGGTTEHSIADGSEFDHIMENFVYIDTQVLEYPSLEEQKAMEKITYEDRKRLILAERLDIEVDEEMSKEIIRCVETYAVAKDDVDLAAGAFRDFGKGLIKKCGVSPDAFIQMAIQLANYRDQGKFVLTYEAASARFYSNSRTETLRTVSDLSCEFVKSMEDSSVSKEIRIKALRDACTLHGQRNRECMVGRGVDRHLFVLFVMSKAFNISSPFLDHYISQQWLLSTSHVPNCTNQVDEDKYMSDTWMGACFGAVAKTGYGVCYRLGGNHSIFAHITSYKSAENTDSSRFRQQFYTALHDMANLFDVK